MKTVDIQVTAEDLQGDGTAIRGCAGYLAIKRVIPDLNCWCFHSGYLFISKGGDEIFVPDGVGEKLCQHSEWQQNSSTGEQAEPFNFQMNIPDHIETRQEING